MAGGFMKLMSKNGPVKGASLDNDHKGDQGWVEIQRLDAPIFRSGGSGAVGQDRGGTTTLGDVTVSRKLDASSPKLAEHTCSGTVFPEVVIELLTDIGGTAKKYYTVTMKNVMMSGYSISGSSEGRADAMENVHLNPENIQWDFQGYKPDGSPGDKGTGKYDPGANKA